MPRKRDGFVPLGDVAEAVALPGDRALAHRVAAPPARHHFTRFDQITQLVNASEADPELGFMARLLALCSLPRTNPGNRLLYKRVNGPYRLYMQAGPEKKLPFGKPAALAPGLHHDGGQSARKAACSSLKIHSRRSCGSWASTAPAVKHTPDSATKWTGSFTLR